MFHVKVRFRKPITQIEPLAGVQETAIETQLNSFKESKEITEDTQDIGLYVTY
jgi:hypothetical protein